MQFVESSAMQQLMAMTSTNMKCGITESKARGGELNRDSFDEYFEMAQRGDVTSSSREKHDNMSASAYKNSSGETVSGENEIDTETLASEDSGEFCDDVDLSTGDGEVKVEGEDGQDGVEPTEQLLSEVVAGEIAQVVVAAELGSQVNQVGQDGQEAAKVDAGQKEAQQLQVAEAAVEKAPQNTVKVDSDATETAAETLGLSGTAETKDGQGEDKAVKENVANTLPDSNAQQESKLNKDFEMMKAVDEVVVLKDEPVLDGTSQKASGEKASQVDGEGMMGDLSGEFSTASQSGNGSSSLLSENNQGGQSGSGFSILNELNSVDNSSGQVASGKLEDISPVDMQGNVDRVVKAARTVVTRGSSMIQLRLDPPELGTLRIEMKHDASGLTMQLQATNTKAHELLQRNAGELHAALEASGIRATKIDIQLRLDLQNDDNSSGQGESNYQGSDQDSSGQSNFSESAQDHYGGGEDQSEYSYSPDLLSGQEEVSSVELAGVGQWQELEFGNVDIQV